MIWHKLSKAGYFKDIFPQDYSVQRRIFYMDPERGMSRRGQSYVLLVLCLFPNLNLTLNPNLNRFFMTTMRPKFKIKIMSKVHVFVG